LNIVTLNELSAAIEEKLDIDTVEARKYANIVMDFFGFEDRIIDNALEQKDRQLFYMLETRGLLNTQREMITLVNGRQWRIHYWLLAKKTILRYSNNQWMITKPKNGQPSQNDDIYSYLPKDMWTTRKNSAI
jgi:hypothetical protein